MRITRLFPMKLKDVTIGKLNEMKSESGNVCMDEMMSLFNCYERNDLSSSMCQVQAQTLGQYYLSHLKSSRGAEAKRIASMELRDK